MGFLSTIIVVDDVLKSRTLYEGILGCKVTDDFGIYNVGFEGGLALYKKTLFRELAGDIEIKPAANDFVLYFEVAAITVLEKEIEDAGFAFIHKVREQPWGQNVFRFYDYDNHIIEIAEAMPGVIKRMYDKGMTVTDIAKKTGYTEDKVMQRLTEAARSVS
jgi:catechol 2,3-dioxygenase-like lactoylglutathione lyase family enzyme